MESKQGASARRDEVKAKKYWLMADLGHLFCVLVSLLHPVSCNGQPKAQGEHKTLFVLGDSLFDPGNNQYLNDSVEGGALPWPYGETYFGHSTGRLSDGRLVPDFIGNDHVSHSLSQML